MTLSPPRSTLFPYTTLFRSGIESASLVEGEIILPARFGANPVQPVNVETGADVVVGIERESRARASVGVHGGGDRKSTRLNSSHTVISYAVFCLKKKKKEIT